MVRGWEDAPLAEGWRTPGGRSVTEVEVGSMPLKAFLMLRDAFYFGVSYWQEPLPLLRFT